MAESLPAGGIRFAAVINGKPKGGKVELKFAVEGTPDGMRLIPLPDGGILIGNDDESVLVLGAPWAVSADGTLIKTRYEIRGSTISQIVEVTDTTVYPVVADPSAWFSSSNCGIGTCTKYWYVRDTLWLSQCCTGTVAAFQMVIGALSWAGGPWAGIPVTSLMGVQYANFSNQLWSAVNNTNAGNPRCLFFKYLIPGGGVTGWWGHVSYYSNNNCWWST